MNEILHLSYSRIDLYTTCPLRYKFKYIDRYPEKPNPYMFFGKIIHEVLRYIFVSPPKLPTIDILLSYYENIWKSEQNKGFNDSEGEEQYFDYGKKIITEFFKKEIEDKKEITFPISVEYRFSFRINDVEIDGVIDRIDKLNDDTLEVIDYKTGAVYDLEKTKRNEQLMIYQLACMEKFTLEPKYLTIYHLPSMMRFRVEKHSEEQLKEIKNKILKIATDIKENKFFPKYDELTCSDCSYQEYCPSTRDKYLKSSERISTLLKRPISEIIDEYGEMSKKKKEIEAKLEVYKEEIIKYCEEKMINRVYGQSYEVTCSSIDRWKPTDTKRIIEILKKEGSLEEVVSFNDSKFQSFFKKAPENIKAKLKHFLELEKSYRIISKNIREKEFDT